jgi:hypothetical protein
MKYEDAINDIMNRFDFNEVHEAMTRMNWVWGYVDGNRVPSVQELRRSALDLLQRTARNAAKAQKDPHSLNQDYFSLETGGFKVTLDTARNNFTLSFMVEETSCWTGYCAASQKPTVPTPDDGWV